MRVIIQRVRSAEVTISDEVYSHIGKGFLILLGVEVDDTREDVEWLARKISSMRIFSDENGKMNLDIKQIGGAILVVSQFTLHASTIKGNRPSFIKSAGPDHAIPLYQYFIDCLASDTGVSVKTGQFGADMQVSLINDGPVTIFMDSKSRD